MSITIVGFPEYEEPEINPPFDFHATNSITLGELVEYNYFNYTDLENWGWDYYNEEQYNRVCQKFIDHYFFRELGIMPVKAWQMRYRNFLNEIMPKYKYAYKLIDDGVNILQDSDIYTKNRRVYSEFPATQLNSENVDFASDANDFQSETVTFGNFIDTMSKLKHYSDIDLMIINDCERLFSCFFSQNINWR